MTCARFLNENSDLGLKKKWYGGRTGNGSGAWKKGGSIHAEVGKDACIFPHIQKEGEEEKRDVVRREAKLVICSDWAPPPASSILPVREKRVPSNHLYEHTHIDTQMHDIDNYLMK